MASNKISIITPSYNQAEYLEECIDSVLSQNYENLEFIVVDGGSTDNSVKIIKKHEKHLDFWVSEKDNGQSHAINKGFAKASGDIITWLNSDDLFTKETLHKIDNYFTDNQGLNLIFGRSLLFGEDRKDSLSQIKKDDFMYRALAGLPFAQPSSFFSKAHLQKNGFLDQSLHYGMDYNFFVPAFFEKHFLNVDDVFSKYRYHSESKSVSQNAGFAKDYARVFSKILRSFSEGKSTIQAMKLSGFYVEGEDKFTPQRQFDANELEKALHYNLLHQLIFYYEAGEIQASHQIVRYLKTEAPDFFNQNQELSSVYWRTKFLNKEFIHLLRKVKTYFT
jgi:glycosyltransferase involved in cell wall biosynthesis